MQPNHLNVSHIFSEACIRVYFQQLLARQALQADQALYLVGLKSERKHLAI